jgi:hypothetical protein
MKKIRLVGLAILGVAVIGTGLHYWEAHGRTRAVDACTAEVMDFEHRHPRKDENGDTETYNDLNARVPVETTQCMVRKEYELYNNTSFDCVSNVVPDCYRRP